MNVLILGLSSIVERRVLPALAALEPVRRVDIVSRSKSAPSAWEKQGQFYDDRATALAGSDADLVYISLPNSEHAPWISAALEGGRHVVVDKPATLSLAEARRCVEQASLRNCLLAEATVFSHHSQVAGMHDFIADAGPLTHIDAHFIVPPMPIGNFRNHRALGGGCLLDMGPYAAAVGRLFGGGAPRALCAFGAPAAMDRDIDMGFSLAADMPNGARFSGHFSFESEYQNRLSLICRGGSLAVERIFSPPADHAPVWQIRRNNRASDLPQRDCDSFLAFLDAVARAVADGTHQAFHDDLLSDAAFRDRLASALGQGEDLE